MFGSSNGEVIDAIRELDGLHSKAHGMSIAWGIEILLSMDEINDSASHTGAQVRSKLRSLYNSEIKDENDKSKSRLDTISSGMSVA